VGHAVPQSSAAHVVHVHGNAAASFIDWDQYWARLRLTRNLLCSSLSMGAGGLPALASGPSSASIAWFSQTGWCGVSRQNSLDLRLSPQIYLAGRCGRVQWTRNWAHRNAQSLQHRTKAQDELYRHGCTPYTHLHMYLLLIRSFKSQETVSSTMTRCTEICTRA